MKRTEREELLEVIRQILEEAKKITEAGGGKIKFRPPAGSGIK